MILAGTHENMLYYRIILQNTFYFCNAGGIRAMDIVQLCEIGMLVAFGFSWPFNIIKSWRSRTAKGKSVIFEFIVVLGYLVGVLGKFITWRNTGVLAYSIWFYFADIAMVTIDIVLYFRNTRLDRQAENNQA